MKQAATCAHAYCNAALNSTLPSSGAPCRCNSFYSTFLFSSSLLNHIAFNYLIPSYSSVYSMLILSIPPGFPSTSVSFLFITLIILSYSFLFLILSCSTLLPSLQVSFHLISSLMPIVPFQSHHIPFPSIGKIVVKGVA